MDLVDDVDLELSLVRFESCLIDEISDIVDPSITRCIDLDHIEHRSGIEGLAVDTLMTGISILEVGTVHRLSENTSTRRLSRSARSMKEVGVSNSIKFEGISEDRRRIVLTDYRIPIFRAIGGIE